MTTAQVGQSRDMPAPPPEGLVSSFAGARCRAAAAFPSDSHVLPSEAHTPCALRRSPPWLPPQLPQTDAPNARAHCSPPRHTPVSRSPQPPRPCTPPQRPGPPPPPEWPQPPLWPLPLPLPPLQPLLQPPPQPLPQPQPLPLPLPLHLPRQAPPEAPPPGTSAGGRSAEQPLGLRRGPRLRRPWASPGRPCLRRPRSCPCRWPPCRSSVPARRPRRWVPGRRRRR
jgi:hypothetical protein